MNQNNRLFLINCLRYFNPNEFELAISSFDQIKQMCIDEINKLEDNSPELVEQIVPLKNFEDLYDISNYGYIIDKIKNNRVETYYYTNEKGKKPYSRLTLYKDNKRYQFTLNLLVGKQFLENYDTNKLVLYKDKNKANNRIDNLYQK